jgi:integrase
MPDYLFRHPNAGWQYRRKVPKALWGIVGRRVWIKYIKAQARPSALAEARLLSVKCDALIAAVGRMSGEERADIARDGGWKEWEVRAGVHDLTLYLAQLIEERPAGEERQEGPRPNLYVAEKPEKGPATRIDFGPPDDDSDPDVQVVKMRRYARTFGREAAAMRKARAGIPGAAPGALLALVDLWERIKAPRGTRTAQRTRQAVELLAKVIGNDVGPQQLTQAHIVAFRNAYAHKGESVQTKNLNSVRAVLAVAVDEGLIPINVAAGIRPRKAVGGKLVDENKKWKPFTAEEMRTILEKAKEVRWGQTSRSHANKHEDVLWVLRLLIYTGARLNEICQLRPQDVYVEAGTGIPVLVIHDAGERQSIKNTASIRKVPLHPAVKEFMAYAQKAGNRDRVFAGLAYTKGSGYGGWLSSHFLKFRQEVCGITRPKVALHSFRHAYIDATINVGMPDEVSRAIVGHAGKGVHARYGQGAGLKVVAEWVAKVDPLA